MLKSRLQTLFILVVLEVYITVSCIYMRGKYMHCSVVLNELPNDA